MTNIMKKYNWDYYTHTTDCVFTQTNVEKRKKEKRNTRPKN